MTVSLKPIGGTPGDATAEQMRVMADLAEAYGHDEIRVSHEQNLILPHVPRWHLPEVYARLKEAGLATANVGLISDIIACPGMDYCALATARSIPVAQEIAEAFADLDRQRDIGPLKIKISGCINACGHHHVGHIGILGLDRAGVENYQITLGGDGTETAAIGEKVGPRLRLRRDGAGGGAADRGLSRPAAGAGRELPRGLSPARRRRRSRRRSTRARSGPMRLEPCALRADPARPDRGAAADLRRGAGRRTCWQAVLAEFPDEVALVSSFGAEAAVLLQHGRGVDRDLPVLMIDSLMLFEETLDYQRDAGAAPRADATSSTCSPIAADLARLDPDDTLHQRDTDACCEIRKVAAARPGAAALAGVDHRAQALPGGDAGGARGLRGGRRRG